ncbi:MAG: DUF4242 domain-containing protein [Burkholderiales bacterium]|nr:MAG: DUF4242 domain-containing protein [Burkholderiales bacterium]
MPRYVIERDLPGAGKLSASDLHDISRKSKDVLQQMGPSIQWEHSYVAGDKIYCVYIAENEADVRRHAELGGFPATRVEKIGSVIDPTNAE